MTEPAAPIVLRWAVEGAEAAFKAARLYERRGCTHGTMPVGTHMVPHAGYRIAIPPA